VDLSTLDTVSAAEEGAVMELRHPATGAVLNQDDGSPVTITLAGSDSERYRKAERSNQNRRLKNSAGRRGLTVTSEELENDNLEVLAAATVAWAGIVLHGESLDCTVANARKVFKEIPWAREQAEQFVAERANFLKVLSKT